MKDKKIIVIGDVHGESTWRKIVEKNMDADKIIFLGDYLDSFDKSPTEQITIFEEIMKLKKENKNKVVTLMGNHDFHYLLIPGERYSGFQEIMQVAYNEMVEKYIKNGSLQMCHYEEDNLLFSHAGVTQTWLANSGYKGEYNVKDISEFINNLFKTDLSKFRFTGGDNTGNNITQSPIWVRPASLFKDKVPNIVQFVGHTNIVDVTEMEGVWMCDALRTSGGYVEIINGEIKDKK